MTTIVARWSGAGADARRDLVTKANTVLSLLGSVAFTAQAVVGLAIRLYGLTTVLPSGLSTWLGWAGAAVGGEWEPEDAPV